MALRQALMFSDAVWAAVLTLLGAIAGYIAKPLSDLLLQRQTNSAQRQEESRAFQRETLLAIQPLLLELWERASATADAAVEVGVEEVTPYSVVPGDIGDAYRVARDAQIDTDTRLAILAVRVADDDARRAISVLRDSARSLPNTVREYAAREGAAARTDTHIREARDALKSSFEAANNRIGEVLRSLYGRF